MFLKKLINSRGRITDAMQNYGSHYIHTPQIKELKKTMEIGNNTLEVIEESILKTTYKFNPKGGQL